MSEQLREYVITLHNYEDLDEFYVDMETLRATAYGCMPERAVPVHNRRPVSRNTHYMLTEDEALKLKADPRVLDIQLHYKEQGLEIRPCWTSTSAYWDKSATATDNRHRNWALYRCITLNANISTWGDDSSPTQSGTVTQTSSGKNVDVVICDGHIDPSHPEFAVNADGTGGSRVKQFDWFSLSLEVTGSPQGTYVYTPYVDANYPDNNGDGISDRTATNDHGAHVAGIACGNTQGWARDANIYNISPYSTNPNLVDSSVLFDYIRVWHKNKIANPDTGRPNPTIVNCSWGFQPTFLTSDISQIIYRGTTYNGPFGDVTLTDTYGLVAFSGVVGITNYISYYQQDIIDAKNEGIIFVGAAGNSSQKIDVPGGVDYDNYVKLKNGSGYFYNRGMDPTANNMIVVGAVSSYSGAQEYKASYSNVGPGLTVWAPGTNIMSAYNSAAYSSTYDQRSSTAYLNKINGTSMASPQVTGMLACVLEQYPRMNHSQAAAYVIAAAKSSQMTSGLPAAYYDLKSSPNRYLHIRQERSIDGNVYPRINVALRPTSGQTFPRPNIYRWGPQLA